MLHLIPAPLHRMALRSAHNLRGLFRQTFRLRIRGVSVIVIDSDERVLLVRHSYGKRSWALPGGGCGRREDPQDCARRELREELALEVANLRWLHDLEETLSGAPHTAHVFIAEAAGEPVPDGREIAEARYFAANELPRDTGAIAMRRIRLWQEQSE